MSQKLGRLSYDTLPVPERLNVSSLAVLRQALQDLIPTEPALVVLKGESETNFCIGLDLDQTSSNQSGLDSIFSAYSGFLAELRDFPRPVVASISGRCLGGGLGIAACADLIFATPEASFGLPELWLGLVPGICSVVLEDRMSRQQIRRLALMASAIDAEEAFRIGLVDEIQSDRAALERSLSRFSRRAKEYTTASVSLFKRFLVETKTRSTKDAFVRSREMMNFLSELPETRELLAKRLEQLK